MLYTSIQEVNNSAMAMVLPIDAQKDVREYFNLARNALQQAAQCRKAQDWERMYVVQKKN